MTTESTEKPGPRPWLSRPSVLAAIVVVVLVGLRLLPVVAQALLVVFGAVVMATMLDGVSNWVARHTPASRVVALGSFLFLCLALCGLTLWLMGHGISNQFGELTERISEGVQQLNSTLRNIPWTRNFMENGGISGSGLMGSELWGRVGGVFSTAFGAVANGLILLITAIYLAMDPEFYVRNTLRLAPVSKRPRYREVVAQVGSALRWWFVGRFSSMALTGLLTAIGLWIVQVPMAFALGLITAILCFVPFVGPIAAAIPGILVAWSDEPNKALYALAVYLAVQLLESNLITPLIQKKAVSVPPALLIGGQLLLGSFFGFWGVLWSTPLIVTLMVLVKLLYLEDVLHEGEQNASDS